MKSLFKIIALLSLSALMLFSVGCGDAQDESAEVTDSEPVVIELGEGLPDITLDRTDYTIGEITDEMAENGVEEYYVGDDEICDVTVNKVSNEEGQTLEEYFTDYCENLDACPEYSSLDGVECGLTTYYVESTNYIHKAYFFENEEGFTYLSFIYHTVEIQLGDSDYYVWIPSLYEKTAYDGERPEYDVVYDPGDYRLPEIAIAQWNNDEEVYADVVSYHEDDEEEYPITEDQWNNWAEDGWTLEELDEYYSAAFDVSDNADFDIDGVKAIVNQVSFTKNGEDWTKMMITFPDGDSGFVEMECQCPSSEWPGMGKALYYATHIGCESL